MPISKANPIEFWSINDKTYNERMAEKSYGLVNTKPYIHQWQCDDPIKHQVSNIADITNDYVIIIKDRNGAAIDIIKPAKSLVSGPGIDLSFSNYNFIGTLAPWTQHGDGSFQETWAWISNGVIKSDGSLHGDNFRNSYYLKALRPDGYSFGWPPGNYTIRFVGNNSSTGANRNQLFCQIFASDDGFNTLSAPLITSPNQAFGAMDFSVNFILTEYWTEIGFSFSIAPPGNVAITILNSVTLTNAPSSETYAAYDFNFTGNDISTPICGQLVQFFINQSSGGTLDEDTLDVDTLDVINDADNVYKSDFHLFISEILVDENNGSELIYFKSQKNYAGLNYPTDGNYFALRLPCKFFLERISELSSSIDLTSESIDTATYQKFQKWLQFTNLPMYILNKIQMALKHSIRGSLLIESKEWSSQQEQFNRNTPSGDIRFAEQSADIWLTQKDNNIRNII